MVSDENVAGLADELYDAIGLLRRRSRRLVGAPLPELALSGAQHELLRVVRRNPGITVTEAAHLLGLAANTVSTLVSQLLPLGVLVRERDATDRRVARLDLTPSAREGLEQWRDRRTQATVTALARLPAGERAACRRPWPPSPGSPPTCRRVLRPRFRPFRLVALRDCRHRRQALGYGFGTHVAVDDLTPAPSPTSSAPRPSSAASLADRSHADVGAC